MLTAPLGAAPPSAGPQRSVLSREDPSLQEGPSHSPGRKVKDQFLQHQSTDSNQRGQLLWAELPWGQRQQHTLEQPPCILEEVTVHRPAWTGCRALGRWSFQVPNGNPLFPFIRGFLRKTRPFPSGCTLLWIKSLGQLCRRRRRGLSRGLGPALLEMDQEMATAVLRTAQR